MDDNDLELFARDHLSYEVWMLGETAQWLITVPPSATLATRNAYLESFGIHARTLGAFLANSGTHADDVLAKHYSSNWPGEDPVPGLAKIVNKQVAHLTAVRLEKRRNSQILWIGVFRRRSVGCSIGRFVRPVCRW